MIKLICMDMDGVLVPVQNFWLELHKALGTLEEGTKLTKAYLTTDYGKLVEEVVGKLWAGRDASRYYELVNTTPYQPGIQEFFAALGKFDVPRAIITGGCYDVAERIKNDFGITFIFANQLKIKNNTIMGEFQWPVGTGGATKARIIEQLCDDLEILPAEVLMIGDSDSDIDAFRIVGVSIAFNSASKRLKETATYVVDSNDLRNIIPILTRISEEGRQIS